MQTPVEEDIVKWEEERDVRNLIKALDNPSVEKNARIFAIHALGRIGDPSAINALVAAMHDTDGNVQFWASQTLGKMGQAAVTPLIACTEDRDKYVRISAVAALGTMSDPRAAEAIMNCRWDEDPEVQAFVAKTLASMNAGPRIV